MQFMWNTMCFANCTYSTKQRKKVLQMSNTGVQLLFVRELLIFFVFGIFEDYIYF